MLVLEILRMAFRNLSGNPFRTFLTMLGVIIGVASVIALVAVGQGATARVTEQIQGLGSNLISVNIVGRGSQTALRSQDVEEWVNLPGVGAVAPEVVGSATVKAGTSSVSVPLEGVTPEFARVRNLAVAEGRFISDLDLLARSRVVLLGANTAVQLFGSFDPVGQEVTLNGTTFTVVGVLAPMGTTLGASNDDRVLVPLTTAERFLQSRGVRTVYVQAASSDEVRVAVDSLRRELMRTFRGDENSFSIFTQEDVLRTIGSVSNTLSLMLGGIAGISLLVGGIGIMNIMLVSVSERTKEIGLRKAIGARRSQILLQFLLESLVLSLLGGVFGVLVGFGIGALLERVLHIPVLINWSVIGVATLFSLAVGLVFGILPAVRAANLDPIVALRYE
ncbi:MAG: Macrolide export ATP-binding/permease protein MacB [Brockia lithotrophica]|uniref:Macrolide export ATP-binding/permease protein MacB n=1 Tax=Brockia lithotrophica TaxID=933949 RepID=A0A2T5G5M5_9BACL|nr:ABC transporter permease [Brockia lithotrophica]PTQ51492.1 MAG: Macrolide export ATP-binding/permease protein MacB [Brockia lithotrophica]